MLAFVLLTSADNDVPTAVRKVAQNLSHLTVERDFRFPRASEEPRIGEPLPPLRVTTTRRWYLKDRFREEATYPLAGNRVHFSQAAYRNGILRTREGLRDAKGKESGVEVSDMQLPGGLSAPFAGAYISLDVPATVKPSRVGNDEIRRHDGSIQIRRLTWAGMIARETRRGEVGGRLQEQKFEITAAVRVGGAWLPKSWSNEFWRIEGEERQPISRSLATFSDYRIGKVRESDVAWIQLRPGDKYLGSL